LWVANAIGSAAFAQQSPEQIYNSGHFPTSIGKFETDATPTGTLQTYLPAGGVPKLADNAFFQSLGVNGRSCGTCHQPPSGMGVSVVNIQARYTATSGLDPIFAKIDGANCPDKVTSRGQPPSAYSLLMGLGVFRIARPVPANAQFTVQALSDPNGCNPIGRALSQISVYRRPLITTNLDFVLATNPLPHKTTAAPPAIMWDMRETTLEQQAIDATLGHAQATQPPTAAQLNQIVAFEKGLFSAQIMDKVGGNLTGDGATGGAVVLSGLPTNIFQPDVTFTQFDAWRGVSGTGVAARRASIFRGQQIFNTRKFVVSNVEGIVGEIPEATCNTCHGQQGDGNDASGQGFSVDIGVGGSSPQFGGPQPLKELPIFKVTCKPSFSTQFHGSVVVTNDPGRAITTGKCRDIGRFKVPQARALTGHAPYFHDGSAATMTDVVNFYNKRFSIGLSSQDVMDLVHFLNSL
jgi:hypothetical protein